jgi:DNA-binding transcriptional regulator GbsR (MarR family)
MPSNLDQSKALLVRRWGELGGYWGISRTMAEIHALLFVSGQPLCTDDVMAQLHVSRGNASMNLRALVDWGLVQRVHQLGDRKEYFQADTDVWHMFETIMRERRRREVEPIIATIERCRKMIAQAAGEGGAAGAPDFCRRLDELQDFLTTMSALFELVVRFGGDGVRELGRFITQAAPPASAEQAALRGSRSQSGRADTGRSRANRMPNKKGKK